MEDVVRYLPTERMKPTAESSSHGLVSLSGLTSEHLFHATHLSSQFILISIPFAT